MAKVRGISQAPQNSDVLLKMKHVITGVLLYLSSLALYAGSDEENHPMNFREQILASPFVFVGKLKITDYRFISEDQKVVPDPEGKILKEFLTNRFESVLVPYKVYKWSVVKPSKMLVGEKVLLEPFLTESWSEPSRSMCPHHVTALSGDERIWFVVIPEDFKEMSLCSMPIRHLDAVMELLKE